MRTNPRHSKPLCCSLHWCTTQRMARVRWSYVGGRQLSEPITWTFRTQHSLPLEEDLASRNINSESIACSVEKCGSTIHATHSWKKL